MANEAQLRAQKKYRASLKGKETIKNRWITRQTRLGRWPKTVKTNEEKRSDMRLAAKKYSQSEKGKATILRYSQISEYHKKKRQNPKYRLMQNLRAHIRRGIAGDNNSQKSRQLLGCSVETLRTWLALTFEPEMTWENYGKLWHVDHIRPCCSFDLTNSEEQKNCFHFTNLQPLFYWENYAKGGQF